MFNISVDALEQLIVIANSPMACAVTDQLSIMPQLQNIIEVLSEGSLDVVDINFDAKLNNQASLHTICQHLSREAHFKQKTLFLVQNDQFINDPRLAKVAKKELCLTIGDEPRTTVSVDV
jgi:hypothetical protein